jgi:hypothetical protein
MGARVTWEILKEKKGETDRGSLRERRNANQDQSCFFMKVRAAVWYQGWGKGQTCEQVDGENVSSTCYRRQTERTKGRDERVSKIICTACKFVTFDSRQCFVFVVDSGGC